MRGPCFEILSSYIDSNLAWAISHAGWLFYMLLGLIVIWNFGLASCEKFNISPWKFSISLAIAAIFAYSGGKFYHQLTSTDSGLYENLLMLSPFRGGLASSGAIVGGGFAFLLSTRLFKMPTLRIFDIMAPLGILGIGITRIGCFLNGCCWGKPTQLIWGVQYPASTPAHMQHILAGWIPTNGPLSAPVHPIQLYETVYTFFAFVLGRYIVDPRRKFDGQTCSVVLIVYSVCRIFLNDPLRLDHSSYEFWLSYAQYQSIVTIILCMLSLKYLEQCKIRQIKAWPIDWEAVQYIFRKAV